MCPKADGCHPSQVFGVLWVKASGWLYSLSSCGLNKWEVDENCEQQVLSWSTNQIITDSIADAIWVRITQTLVGITSRCPKHIFIIVLFIRTQKVTTRRSRKE